MENNVSALSDEELMSALSDDDLKQLAGISDKKYTGNPSIDMAEANKNQATAEYNASLIGQIDRGVGIALNPVTQQILGAAKTVTGGGSQLLENTGLIPKSNPNDAFNKLGQMVGYIPVANASTVIMKSVPGLAGKNLISLMAQQSAAGAAAGAYGTSENRTAGALTGASLGALLPAVSALGSKGIDFLKNIPGALNQIKDNIKNIKDPAQFGSQVRESLFNAKKTVGQTFGRELDDLAKNNPTRVVDHSADFQRLKDAINDTENNPGLSTTVNGIIRRVKNPAEAKKLQYLIDNPSKASSLTLQESQNLKVAIQNAPDIATKLAKGKFADYSPADLEILDLLDNVKMSQANVFPELAKVRAPYAKFMQNYDQVKTMFKPNQLLNQIRSGFKNEEVNKIIETILPEKTINNITGFRNAEKVVGVAKKAAITGALGTIGYKGIKSLTD